MVDAEHVITKEELLSLQHLKLAGETFDLLAPISMYTLANGLYEKYNTWFPYDLADSGDAYREQAVLDIESAVDAEVLSNYTTTKTAVTNAKKALYDFIESTPPILALVNHANWTEFYFPALCKKGSMPPLADITTACADTNDTHACEAATTLADLTDAQRTEFNTKFNATLDTFAPFAPAGYAMDVAVNTTVQAAFRSLDA